MASRLRRLFGVFAMLACAPLAQEHAGPHQSPIDIRAPKAADLPPIQVAYRAAPRRADAFGRIYPRDARPTQPLNGRDVLMSK